jgi:hypothetical protein
MNTEQILSSLYSRREGLINEVAIIDNYIKSLRGNSKRSTLADVQEFITEHELDKRSRVQQKVYYRTYLSVYLKLKHKLTHSDIGRMFNLKHDIIVHYMNRHDAMYLKNETYMETIKDLKIKFML